MNEVSHGQLGQLFERESTMVLFVLIFLSSLLTQIETGVILLSDSESLVTGTFVPLHAQVDTIQFHI